MNSKQPNQNNFEFKVPLSKKTKQKDKQENTKKHSNPESNKQNFDGLIDPETGDKIVAPKTIEARTDRDLSKMIDESNHIEKQMEKRLRNSYEQKLQETTDEDEKQRNERIKKLFDQKSSFGTEMETFSMKEEVESLQFDKDGNFLTEKNIRKRKKDEKKSLIATNDKLNEEEELMKILQPKKWKQYQESKKDNSGEDEFDEELEKDSWVNSLNQNFDNNKISKKLFPIQDNLDSSLQQSNESGIEKEKEQENGEEREREKEMEKDKKKEQDNGEKKEIFHKMEIEIEKENNEENDKNEDENKVKKKNESNNNGGDQDEGVNEDLEIDTFEKELSLLKKLVPCLQDGETPSIALGRLQKRNPKTKRISRARRKILERKKKKLLNSNSNSTQSHDKQGKESERGGESDNQRNQLLSNTISDAVRELVKLGRTGIYSISRKDLIQEIKFRIQKKKREKQKIQSLWQYKWKLDDTKTYGPFPASQMIQWHKSGAFTNVYVKKTNQKTFVHIATINKFD
ncbi:protein lin1 [Anaeramoeba flamelloides]|uniref:Protein lin1 n=1 Tax=Anaeramoeba flamelloides TaxID=1746091 RepID=A0ABQ8YEY7_9EUKA|nr:protein lin1 [Anaeramoeba flamelloides]